MAVADTRRAEGGLDDTAARAGTATQHQSRGTARANEAVDTGQRLWLDRHDATAARCWMKAALNVAMEG